MKELELQACVYSRTAPEEAQLRAFLNQKYRRPVRLRWERETYCLACLRLDDMAEFYVGGVGEGTS